jgi:hypothetical protein
MIIACIAKVSQKSLIKEEKLLAGIVQRQCFIRYRPCFLPYFIHAYRNNSIARMQLLSKLSGCIFIVLYYIIIQISIQD